MGVCLQRGYVTTNAALRGPTTYNRSLRLRRQTTYVEVLFMDPSLVGPQLTLQHGVKNNCGERRILSRDILDNADIPEIKMSARRNSSRHSPDKLKTRAPLIAITQRVYFVTIIKKLLMHHKF